VKAGRFRVGDVRSWAAAQWPDCDFTDVPHSPNTGGASGRLPALRGTAAGYSSPDNLPDAITEIHALRGQISSLRKTIEMAEGQIRALEPDATSWRDWNKKKERPRKN
jgi:hypothetical protein